MQARLLMIVLTLVSIVGVLQGTASRAGAKTIQVVASFSVLADVVANIGGDHVRVVSLVGPNGDPHSFEPSPEDAQMLKDADVVIVSGEGLEGWFERLATASGYSGTPVVASEGVQLRKRERQGEISDDPHVWNSPLNVLVWASNIEKVLIAADPEDAAAFRTNADQYAQALHELDACAHAEIDPVPPDKRKVLTSHDAFGYLGRDYGITFLSPLGLSTETEASAAGLAKLIEQIKAEGIKVYFIENSNDPRLVEQIAAATGAHPGGKLYAESLSTADGPAPSYLKMFRYNLDEITKGFASP
jgi:zinc/manganese transport system substrate-binding protein